MSVQKKLPCKFPGMTKLLARLVNLQVEENGGNLPDALRSVFSDNMTPAREAFCGEWDEGAASESCSDDLDENPLMRANGTVTCSGCIWMGGTVWDPISLHSPVPDEKNTEKVRRAPFVFDRGGHSEDESHSLQSPGRRAKRSRRTSRVGIPSWAAHGDCSQVLRTVEQNFRERYRSLAREHASLREATERGRNFLGRRFTQG